MVFNMLKGMKRLILTTVAFCGVGLFLCGTEVKAETPRLADSVTTNVKSNENRIIVTVENRESEEIYIESVDLIGTVNGSDSVKKLDSLTDEIASGGTKIYSFTNLDLVGTPTSTTVKTVNEIKVIYHTKSDPSTHHTLTDNKTNVGLGYTSAPTYQITATLQANSTKMDGSTVKINDAASPYYGFEGDALTFAVTPATGAAIANYYQNVTTQSTAPKWYEAGWEDAAEAITGKTVGSADAAYIIEYFPKIKDVKLNTITPESPDVATAATSTSPAGPVDVHLKGSKTDKIDITYELIAASEASEDNTVLAAIASTGAAEGLIVLPDFTNGMTNISKIAAKDDGSKKITITLGDSAATSVNNALTNDASTGSIKPVFKVYHANGSNADTPAVIGFTSSAKDIATVYAKASKVDGGSVDLVVQPGASITADLTQGAPTGADWAKILGQSLTTVSTDNTQGVIISSDSGTTKAPTYSYEYKAADKKGVITFTAAADATIDKTTTFKVTFTDNTISGTPTVITKTFKVKVETINTTKTEEAIKNSNQNFITVGYKLDMNALLKDCVSSSTAKLGIAPDEISMGSSDVATYDSTTKMLEGKKAGTVTLTAKWGSTTVSVPVTVYPTPTATLNSGRTVTVTMPKQISTGYKADKNIRNTTGFLFELRKTNDDSSVLFAYDTSKYQNIANASDKSSKYSYSDNTYSFSVTIPASDVEGMVTAAGSNGKFNQDPNSSTDVKFRATPMGVEATSSNTVTAKEEIGKKAETSATKVYCIQAYGSNMNNSYAYGLSGQKVQLTAYPASGYKFVKWKDYNNQSTKNPETITVTGTGQRYEVLGERVGANGNGTGTGNGTGGDNSSLYDDVPKTAESNSAIWLIVFMVFAVMGTAYALYLQLKAATSKNGR